jgi:hypothetical protein
VSRHGRGLRPLSGMGARLTGRTNEEPLTKRPRPDDAANGLAPDVFRLCCQRVSVTMDQLPLAFFATKHLCDSQVHRNGLRPSLHSKRSTHFGCARRAAADDIVMIVPEHRAFIAGRKHFKVRNVAVRLLSIDARQSRSSISSNAIGRVALPPALATSRVTGPSWLQLVDWFVGNWVRRAARHSRGADACQKQRHEHPGEQTERRRTMDQFVSRIERIGHDRLRYHAIIARPALDSMSGRLAEVSGLTSSIGRHAE